MVKSFKTNLLTWLKTKTYIKTEIDELLQLKSNIGHTHTNASTTTPGFLSAEDKTKLNNLEQITVDSTINATSTNPVQNKVINTALTGKANTNHTHSITNITNLQSQLDGKANSVHTHDDRYYTETEMNTKLNGKANSSHTHTASQISDLTVSTHTLANGAKLYKYGKIVMCVLFNVAFSGKKAYTWNDLFTNIPSTYQPIGGTNPIYAHSSEIMLSVQGSSIQIYPHKTSGSVFNTLVWITA